MPFVKLVETTKGATGGAAVTTDAADFTGVKLGILAVGSFWPIGDNIILDSESNIWNQVLFVDGSQERIDLYCCINPVVSNAFTVTNNKNNFSSLALYGFSGDAVFDETPLWDVEASVTSITNPNYTPAEDNELVVAALCLRDDPGTGDTVTVSGTGFSGTRLIQVPGVASNRLEVALAYSIQTTATTTAPEFAWTNTDAAATIVASFKFVATSGDIRRKKIMNLGLGGVSIAGSRSTILKPVTVFG